MIVNLSKKVSLLMENYNPLLIDILPGLANRIKNYFISKSRTDLVNQVDNLRIKGLCECGEPDCGSFYLTEYQDNEHMLEGFAFTEIGTIEVYEGKIGFIEIFPNDFGFQVRSRLMKNNVSY